MDKRGDVCTAYRLQTKNLHLKPWQIRPMDIDDPDNPDEGRGPARAQLDGRYEAAALLKRMLAAGVSRYHPDPMAAIEEAERERAGV